jgi:ribose 5-phosphate isomerase
MADRGIVVTDGGNVIYDLPSGVIAEPAALAAALKTVTGVVDHGLFLDLATRPWWEPTKGWSSWSPRPISAVLRAMAKPSPTLSQ